MTQEYDLRNTPSIEASVRHSDVVYNLVGRDYPTKYEYNEYGRHDLAGMLTVGLGTSPWRTSTLRARRELLRQSLNTMWTVISMFRRIARTPNLHQSSMQPRLVLRTHIMTLAALTSHRDEPKESLGASSPRQPSCDPLLCSASRITSYSNWLRP